MKTLLIPLLLLAGGCAVLNESLTEADSEVARWIDTYCLNTVESVRAERRAAINELTKVGDIAVTCE